MMREEFEQRTGFLPSQPLYSIIEKYYMNFDGDKDAFCKAYKKDADGLATKIQREAGRLLGKSNQTVSAWEQGRGQPDADMFLKLCEVYNVESVSVFFGEAPPEPVLSVDERELLESWREATDAARESALMVLKSNKRPLVKKGKAM